MGVSSGTGNGSIEIDFAMSVLKQNSHKNEKFLPYKVFFFYHCHCLLHVAAGSS